MLSRSLYSIQLSIYFQILIILIIILLLYLYIFYHSHISFSNNYYLEYLNNWNLYPIISLDISYALNNFSFTSYNKPQLHLETNEKNSINVWKNLIIKPRIDEGESTYLEILMKNEFVYKNGTCKNGYKKCGYLDEYRILCYPLDKKCPINHIYIDKNEDIIQKNNANYITIPFKIDEKFFLHFSNDYYEGKIINQFRIDEFIKCDIKNKNNTKNINNIDNEDCIEEKYNYLDSESLNNLYEQNNILNTNQIKNNNKEIKLLYSTYLTFPTNKTHLLSYIKFIKYSNLINNLKYLNDNISEVNMTRIYDSIINFILSLYILFKYIKYFKLKNFNKAYEVCIPCCFILVFEIVSFINTIVFLVRLYEIKILFFSNNNFLKYESNYLIKKNLSLCVKMDIIFLIIQFIIIGLVCFIKFIPFIVKGFPRNYFLNIYMNRVGNRFPNFNRFTNFNNRDYEIGSEYASTKNPSEKNDDNDYVIDFNNVDDIIIEENVDIKNNERIVEFK
jgi:hypothetical protein